MEPHAVGLGAILSPLLLDGLGLLVGKTRGEGDLIWDDVVSREDHIGLTPGLELADSPAEGAVLVQKGNGEFPGGSSEHVFQVQTVSNVDGICFGFVDRCGVGGHLRVGDLRLAG